MKHHLKYSFPLRGEKVIPSINPQVHLPLIFNDISLEAFISLLILNHILRILNSY